LPEEQLTFTYLDLQYTYLLDRLVDDGEAVITAYMHPLIPKETWLKWQLARIEKFREARE